jgi:ribosome biogenesis GTPase
MNGIVLKSTGKWYQVLLEDQQVVQASIRGKLRIDGLKTTNPIAAGDRVILDEKSDFIEGREEYYTIRSIEDRHNYIVRKSTNLSKQMQILAANIDRAYLVVTLKSPVTQVAFIDRFLVAAESFRIPTTILFNKVDLFSDEENVQFHYLKSVYEKAGYPCYPISAREESTVDFLREEINGHQVMISGNSGVGKTTLVNSLDASLDLRTGEISKAHEQGKHTTTFAEMHPLASGGFIIDTPGIRAFGIVDLEKAHYAHYFPEMRALLGECRFNNCLHMNEPHCAVKAAVENEEIAPHRYNTYLQLMHEDDSDPHRRSDY